MKTIINWLRQLCCPRPMPPPCTVTSPWLVILRGGEQTDWNTVWEALGKPRVINPLSQDASRNKDRQSLALLRSESTSGMLGPGWNPEQLARILPRLVASARRPFIAVAGIGPEWEDPVLQVAQKISDHADDRDVDSSFYYFVLSRTKCQERLQTRLSTFKRRFV